jgi:hypothetical protein
LVYTIPRELEEEVLAFSLCNIGTYQGIKLHALVSIPLTSFLCNVDMPLNTKPHAVSTSVLRIFLYSIYKVQDIKLHEEVVVA